MYSFVYGGAVRSTALVFRVCNPKEVPFRFMGGRKWNSSSSGWIVEAPEDVESPLDMSDAADDATAGNGDMEEPG